MPVRRLRAPIMPMGIPKSDAHQKGAAGQLQGGADVLRIHIGHRSFFTQADTEVALREIPDIVHKLLRNRFIQAVLDQEPLLLVRGQSIREHDIQRVAREPGRKKHGHENGKTVNKARPKRQPMNLSKENPFEPFSGFYFPTLSGPPGT